MRRAGPHGPGVISGANQNPLEMSVRLCFLMLAPVALTGCHLIDQTDFSPKRAIVAPPPVPSPETRPALVTIDYTSANPDYGAALAGAIKAVEARRPGTLYDVTAVVGTAGEAASGRSRAAEVLTAVEAQGVIPARVQLGLMLEPGRKVQQVRVYLR